jgi:hypothetical protein
LPPKELELTEDQIVDLVEETIAEHRNGKPLDQLDVDEIDRLLEDDMDDDRVLEQYRQKRMNEMRQMNRERQFGEMHEISKPDFIREVTEASKKCWVVVFLYKQGLDECRVMERLLRELARQYAQCKFVSIVGDRCIEGYPDRNLPTLLIYGQGDLRKQQVGAQQLGGLAMTRERLERFLMNVGAINTPTAADADAENSYSDEDTNDDD